ncbi:hypothetical protein DdX_19340 [Ditylenchus destructor]|uniref:Uncharacterized protein n=1 Tax=Ditylenchus destructor TaxID=166010 RepID=A0AAD4QXC6_9BILA|nr:hypothetical protein DdX_19340 [Ditylenchus destructor]
MFPARPVPIVLSRREEAIDVSHARIRAPTRNLPFYVTHVTHGCHVFTYVNPKSDIDINSTTELYNEQNEPLIQLLSLTKPRRFSQNSDSAMQTQNNQYYLSNGAPDAYYVVVDSGFIPYFDEESVSSSGTPAFQSLLKVPNEELG